LERSYHEDAVAKVESLKQSFSSGDIASKLSAHAQQIEHNRAIPRAVISEIEMCGRMNLPLRGHRDSSQISIPTDEEAVDYRQGNLNCLLKKPALKDSVLMDHLKMVLNR